MVRVKPRDWLMWKDLMGRAVVQPQPPPRHLHMSRQIYHSWCQQPSGAAFPSAKDYMRRRRLEEIQMVAVVAPTYPGQCKVTQRYLRWLRFFWDLSFYLRWPLTRSVRGTHNLGMTWVPGWFTPWLQACLTPPLSASLFFEEEHVALSHIALLQQFSFTTQ